MGCKGVLHGNVDHHKGVVRVGGGIVLDLRLHARGVDRVLKERGLRGLPFPVMEFKS